MSHRVDPTLFTHWDLSPMVFILGRIRNSQELEKMIDDGGGVVVPDAAQSAVHYPDRDPIRLVARSSFQACSRQQNQLYDCRFVHDCVQNNEHKDLAEYLVQNESDDDQSDLTLTLASDDEAEPGEPGRPARCDFTRDEGLEILTYIQSKGLFNLVKGRAVWVSMHNAGVCNGHHSWQSLKQHFIKKLYPSLRSYNISPESRGKFQRGMRTGFKGLEESGSVSHTNVLRRTPYSKAEELKVLLYIAKNKRYADVRGVELWKSLEQRKILPNRSWQSMKERFLKYTLTNLDSFKSELSPQFYTAFCQLKKN